MTDSSEDWGSRPVRRQDPQEDETRPTPPQPPASSPPPDDPLGQYVLRDEEWDWDDETPASSDVGLNSDPALEPGVPGIQPTTPAEPAGPLPPSPDRAAPLSGLPPSGEPAPVQRSPTQPPPIQQTKPAQRPTAAPYPVYPGGQQPPAAQQARPPAQPPPPAPRQQWNAPATPLPRNPASRQQPPLPQPPAPRRRSGCGRFLLTLLVLAAVVLLFLGLALVGYASVARDLPQPDELQERASQFASTIIYDRDGGVLNEVADPNYGRRTVVPLDRISPYVIDATIATEDPNFYQHPGVDPVGVARAIYYAIRERDLNGPGGSTITQQLVKLTFLSPERTMTRKVKEAILAAEITRRYSKDTILQIYLNELNYGNLAYGIQAAAETYFNRPAADLSLAQAAMLAGIPQAPAYYDPYTKLWETDGQPGPVKRRQGEVLRLMVERGFVTTAQADAAWAEPLVLKPLTVVYDSKYPHFVLYARNQVEQTIGPELANRGGLRIYTTLDPALQDAAQEQVRQQVARLASQNARNGAVVAVRPNTGEILAMVGSADFNSEEISGQINMAVAPRQPGSALKPLVYLSTFEMPASVSSAEADLNAALEARLAALAGPTPAPGQESQQPDPVSAIEPPGYWTSSTAIMDITTQFPDGANPPFVPTNYDNKEHGLVTVRSALANSLNIPAVKALQHAGLDRLRDVARRAGITTLNRPDYGLSLALGGGDVTLLELTGAYATLGNAGTRTPVSPIACVFDANAQLIWRGAAAEAVTGCLGGAQGTVAVMPQPSQAAFNPQHTALITSILSDVNARQPMFGGAANVMTLPDRPVAVKTGTTNDYRDAWTIGYTPDLAVGVWVGNADNSAMDRLAGSLGAAPVWHGVMLAGLQGSTITAFSNPGVQGAQVCADSGTLPSEACPNRREDLYANSQGPLPAAYDLWQRVRIDRVTGQLATEFTPEDRVETVDRMIFPPRYHAWAAAHGYPVLGPQRPPLEFSPELELRVPANNSLVSGAVLVEGRVRLPEPLVWRLEYGVGPNPEGWGVLSGPHPGGEGDPLGREVDGALGEWDVAGTAAQHDTTDFSLRLVAYQDSSSLDYPVATSNVVYVQLEEATPTPTETASPTPTETSTPAATETGTPEVTATATPTPQSDVTPAPTTATPPPVATLRAVIIEPVDRTQVFIGETLVRGTADGPGFQGYILEFAPGLEPAEDEWEPVSPGSAQPVSGGLLDIWNTSDLAPGIYSLRLRVFDVTGGGAISQVLIQLIPAQ
jgi:membrane peptidoglycan carboxypeptidase